MLSTRENLSFTYFFQQWVRQAWDHMGHLLWIAFLFFVTFAVAFAPVGATLAYYHEKELPFFPVGVFLPTGLLFGFWGTCLGWLAFHRSVDQLLAFEDLGWIDYAYHLNTLLKKSFQFAAFLSIVGSVLGFNILIYPKMLTDYPGFRVGALLISCWMLLFLGMVQVHLVPFLVHQDRPFMTALSRAVKVTLLAPFRTLFLLLVEILVAVLFFPPLCFILPGVIAIGNQISLLILLEDWEDPYEKTSEALRTGV